MTAAEILAVTRASPLDGRAGRGLKATYRGTHRVCHPGETWRRIAPLLPRAGITRVADLTGLDDIGIPVYQAVRPGSRSLSVSQGKGITREHSRVSAVMESFEVFHAEEPPLDGVSANAVELRELLTYDPARLNLRHPSVYHDGIRLLWYPAVSLSGRSTYIPAAIVHMDTRVDDQSELKPVVFHRDSNGLASGNTKDEAIVHALYEIAERSAHAAARERPQRKVRAIDPATVGGGDAQVLLDHFRRSATRVRIIDVTLPGWPPCFQVKVWSPSFPVLCFGAGCHADPGVALCRALTEAAQSRITAISGMREDVDDSVWHVIQKSAVDEPVLWEDAHLSFSSVPPAWEADSLDEDLAKLTGIFVDKAGVDPLVVNLTRPDFGIPVVKVIAPGLPVYMP